MKTNLLTRIAIVCITTMLLCGYTKETNAQSPGSTPAPQSNKDTNTVTVTAREVDAELDRRIHYFDSIFGSVAKVEEYYGKSIAQLKKDFRGEVEMELIAAKKKSLNPGSK
jgi:hypothetical protein